MPGRKLSSEAASGDLEVLERGRKGLENILRKSTYSNTAETYTQVVETHTFMF